MDARTILTTMLPFVADPSTKAATLLILAAMYAQAAEPTVPTVSEKPIAAKFSGLGSPTMFNLAGVAPGQIAAASAVAQAPGLYEDQDGNLKLPYYGGAIPFQR